MPDDLTGAIQDTNLREALPGLRRTHHHVRPHLRRERPLLLGGLLALLAEVAMRLLEPWPLKFVIDAVVDADVPLIPPHLTASQVLLTAKAEFSGDPAFFGIVAEGVRETVVSKAKAVLGRNASNAP